MAIEHLSSNASLAAVVEKAKDELVVIDFHATWCGHCNAIAPFYEEMSKKYSQAVYARSSTNSTAAVLKLRGSFTKCDVDAVQEVAKQFSVSALPTFVFLKNGRKVDQVRGADRNGIETALKKQLGGAGSSSGHSWGSAQTLASGNASRPMPHPAQVVQGVTNLDPQLKFGLALLLVYVFVWYFFL